MKNLFVVVCALVVLFVVGVYAHPPSAIEVKIVGEKLTVTVIHPVSNPAVHYIGNITLWVNNVKTIDQRFVRQNGESQIVSYNIPGIKKGDKIKIQAVCNKFGDLSKEVVIN